jgi:hypothetical protein
MQIPALAALIFTQIIVVALCGFIYLLVYNHRVNKRLAENEFRGELYKKQMISPLKFVMIIFLCLWGLIFILVIGSMVVYRFNKTDYSSSSGSSYFLPINIGEYDEEEIRDTIYESLSYEEDIAGYDRTTVKDGDVEFVVYRAKENWGGDGTFPTVMVYAHYVGEKQYDYTGYDLEAGNSGGSVGNSSCDCKGGIWFAADTDTVDCNLTLNYFIFTEESRENGMVDDDGEYALYADESGTLKLSNIGEF